MDGCCCRNTHQPSRGIETGTLGTQLDVARQDQVETPINPVEGLKRQRQSDHATKRPLETQKKAGISADAGFLLSKICAFALSIVKISSSV